jgi:hypothetical protein
MVSLSLCDLAIAAAALTPCRLVCRPAYGPHWRIKSALFRRGMLIALALGGIDMLRRAFLTSQRLDGEETGR